MLWKMPTSPSNSNSISTQELAAAENGKLFHEVELPLVEVLTAMEQEGINLNTAFLKTFEGELAADIQRLEKIYTLKPGKNLTWLPQSSWGPSSLKN